MLFKYSTLPVDRDPEPLYSVYVQYSTPYSVDGENVNSNQ